MLSTSGMVPTRGIPRTMTPSRAPAQEKVNKMHVFLNHRELIYGVAHMLGMPIEFPGLRKDSLPSGCSMVVEVSSHMGRRGGRWRQQRHTHLAQRHSL